MSPAEKNMAPMMMLLFYTFDEKLFYAYSPKEQYLARYGGSGIFLVGSHCPWVRELGPRAGDMCPKN